METEEVITPMLVSKILDSKDMFFIEVQEKEVSLILKLLLTITLWPWQ